MNTITINLPKKSEMDNKEITKFLAVKLYEAGKLSLGQAADLAGFSKAAFSEIIGDYGVSLINYSISEIKGDAARI